MLLEVEDIKQQEEAGHSRPKAGKDHHMGGKEHCDVNQIGEVCSVGDEIATLVLWCLGLTVHIESAQFLVFCCCCWWWGCEGTECEVTESEEGATTDTVKEG